MWKFLIISLFFNVILFSTYKTFGFEVTIIFALAIICSSLINPTILNKKKKIIQRPPQQFYSANKKQVRR